MREDLRKLADVAWQAVYNTSPAGRQPRAFGFNVELIFEQDSGSPAFEYLSRRLFNVEPVGNEGWQLVGGAGRLILQRQWNDVGQLAWNHAFNDETESRVFLSVNLHIDGQPLPDEAEIGISLEEVWDKIHDFVQRLDEREVLNG